MGGFVLAIEMSNPSSGARGSVGVGGGSILAGPGVALGRVGDRPEHIGTELLHEGSRHDDDVMPAIDRLCARHGVRARDLSRVAVSIGPGGYTSLRIAVATVKMIAEATGAAVVPVPSASVAAWCIPIGAAPAVVCLASKGESAYGTLLPRNPREGTWWERVGRRAVEGMVPAGVAARLVEELGAGKGWIAASCGLGLIDAGAIAALRPATVIGDAFLPASMREAAGRVGASVVEPVFAAESVLSISMDCAPVDPVALAPLYPREPEAVTLWRKRASGA